MKITVNVDCTPEEARTFLGLPDVQPMQDEIMKDMGQRMKQALAAMDAETMMKIWLPASLQGFEQLQKMFWSQMAAGMTAATGGAPPPDPLKGAKK
ncbi:MAG TPA: DUF6489 family protein [Alphaproteobacteria bacterium]|jgi:hypothetical protein|nr:DUF6489 family protein [Alphaproteobacteria bacterium]